MPIIILINRMNCRGQKGSPVVRILDKASITRNKPAENDQASIVTLAKRVLKIKAFMDAVISATSTAATK